MKDYKKILEGVVNIIRTTEKTDIGFAHICSYLSDNCDELFESEDERIKRNIIAALKGEGYYDCDLTNECIAWLEKQGGQKTDIPKWKYKKDNAPLSKDCLILNRYGCVVKAISGAIVSDAWVLDYNELAKLPKQEEKPQVEAIEEEKVDNSDKVEPKDYSSIDPLFFKTTDKPEPKFKVGEWVVSKTSNLVYRVDSILFPQSKCYYLSHNGSIVLVNFADEQKK